MRFILTMIITISFSAFSFGQVEVIKFDKLDSYLKNNEGTKPKVINFWATWCGPCIKELPYFEEIHKENKAEVLLVSLDFVENLDRVNKFLDRKDISAKVWLLDEIDANSYIDKIDQRWSGAIPMTLIIDPVNNRKIFLEKELTRDELEKQINSLIN